jgi:NAD+ diphosphatase
MEMNFCRRCGSPLKHDTKHIYRCEQGHVLYANCSPSAGVFLITENDEVLLAVRGIEPHKGMLDAFGGFVDGEETFETAAVRELNEELSLEPGEYEQLQYLTSAVGHFAYNGDKIPLLSVLFWSRLKTNKALIASDDVAGIRHIPLREVPLDELHDEDIRTGIKALQKLIGSA